MADRTVALFNLRRGLAELEGYTALPVEHPRDKAGMIQGFEFTFELFWKTFQKLAPDAGLEASSPREALVAAHKMHFIGLDEIDDWTEMLKDRNLTSHTYNAPLADQLLDRLLHRYLPCFRAAMARVQAEIETESTTLK